MTEPTITPELVETAAIVLAEAVRPELWQHAPESIKVDFRKDAHAVLTAVAPLIDRAARTDERAGIVEDLNDHAQEIAEAIKVADNNLVFGLEIEHTTIQRIARVLSAPTEEGDRG